MALRGGFVSISDCQGSLQVPWRTRVLFQELTTRKDVSEAVGHWAADDGAGTQPALAWGIPVSVIGCLRNAQSLFSVYHGCGLAPVPFLELVWQHLSEALEQPGLE